MMGASAETQSTEGMAFVGPDMKFYMAMSKISNGMDKDVEPLGDIGVSANYCGCVYEFDVSEEYVLTAMRALVCGEPIEGDENNACSTESIASPDNLFYTGTFGTEDDHSLLIAEGKNKTNELMLCFWLANPLTDALLLCRHSKIRPITATITCGTMT